MAKTTRLFKSFYKLLLPVAILLLIVVASGSVFFVYEAAHLKPAAYLVTPEKYGQLSTRGARITAENWTNHDGTQARGWLLRGTEGSSSVILLHRYGADRSHVLDLGVKLNEASNFTILMPDQRGHGPDPLVSQTSFGGCESEDALAAIEFLKNLKTADGGDQIGERIGFYGVEMGAFVALNAASKDQGVAALVLDSVPSGSDQVIGSAVSRRFPFSSVVTSAAAACGTYLYFLDGCYTRESSCELAKKIENRQVLLLAGADAPALQESTTKLITCFSGGSVVESKTDFNPAGYNLTNATIEQLAIYDQKVIEFFGKALSQ